MKHVIFYPVWTKWAIPLGAGLGFGGFVGACTSSSLLLSGFEFAVFMIGIIACITALILQYRTRKIARAQYRGAGNDINNLRFL